MKRSTLVLLLTVGWTPFAGCGPSPTEPGSDASARGDSPPILASPQDGATGLPPRRRPDRSSAASAHAGDDDRAGQAVTHATISWWPVWSEGGYLRDRYTAGFNGTSRRGSFSDAVDTLADHPELRLLSVWPHDDGLTEEQYHQLARLRGVEEIIIDTGARVRGPELAPLAEMPNLKRLEFVEAWVDAGTIEALASSDSLEEFRYGSGYDLTPEAERLKVRFRVVNHGNYAP